MIKRTILFGLYAMPLLLQSMDNPTIDEQQLQPAINNPRAQTRNRRNNKLYKMNIDYIIHHDKPKLKIKKRAASKAVENMITPSSVPSFIDASFWIRCVECGKLFLNSKENAVVKQLQRHLSSHHEYTPVKAQETAVVIIEKSADMKIRPNRITKIKWHVKPGASAVEHS